MPELSVQSNITQPLTTGAPITSKATTLKVAVIANFSGHSKGTREKKPLAQRIKLRITKDNFEDIFQSFNVSLDLPICNAPIVFTEFDDLNPDHLYRNIPLFGKYKDLIKKVNTPAQFQLAVEALQAEGLIAETHQEALKRGVLPENLLDNVLGNVEQNTNNTFSADALIRQAIAPYIEAKIDPRADEYTQAVESAVSDLMRSLLHASEFKQLESSWRSLDLINRRLDTDRVCHLSILDAAIPELIEDANQYAADIENSELFKNLVVPNQVAGGIPFDVILIDHVFSDTDSDAKLLQYFAELGQASGARILAGAAIATAGFDSFEELLDGKAPQQLPEGITHAKHTNGAQSVFLATPGMMVRLPYGKKTQPIDSFNFEELPPNKTQHNFYLWGNSAYLLLCSMVQSNGQLAYSTIIDGLPMHVTVDQSGDDLIIPATGYYLPLPVIEKLENAGLTVVQSVKHSDSVLIERWVTFNA